MNDYRGYQLDFSSSNQAMYDKDGRTKKAATIVAVIADHFQASTKSLKLLDVGASTGIIDNYLADFFMEVKGIDIDKGAIDNANKVFQKSNLEFEVGDALRIDSVDDCFDVVVCSQVYEHVPDASRMMAEIRRVLKPGGVCYFAASNRFMWNEPHHNLPLLSVVPRRLAHFYVRLFGKADHYHELHFSYWGLKRLVKDFEVVDYTRKVIEDPVRYKISYMINPGSLKSGLARVFAKYVYFLMPGYIWLLRKG